MRVKVAKSAGFCIGVKRAVELVLRIADEHRRRRIFTFGPLIHNPQTVEMLNAKGIDVMQKLNDGQEGDIVVIRSHGIAPDVREKISAAGYKIFDATCPKVAYVHSVVREHSSRGYATVIVGDANHAEVIGIKGEASGPVQIISSPNEVDELPKWSKIIVVAQTTMDRRTFEAVVERITDRFTDAVVKNTLCAETSYRQDEINALARESDAFVVIGGRNSANTARLNKLCLATGLPTYWVETADELSSPDFDGIERVAVVAGTSTPHWIIARVVERLETMHNRFLPPWRWRWLKGIAYAIIRSNLLAASAMGYLCASLSAHFQIPLAALRGFTAGAAFFGAQNLYENREWQGMALMDPSKVQFVRQTKNILLPASIIAIITAILTSIVLGVFPALTTTIVAIFAIVYWRLPVLERILPASVKDTTLLLVWIALVFSLGTADKLIVLLPVASLGGMRALTMGLKELETDRILQRKSLTAMFGEGFFLVAGAISAILCISPPIAFGIRLLGLYIAIGAMWLLALVVATRAIRKGTYIETIADGIVIIAAALL